MRQKDKPPSVKIADLSVWAWVLEWLKPIPQCLVRHADHNEGVAISLGDDTLDVRHLRAIDGAQDHGVPFTGVRAGDLPPAHPRPNSAIRAWETLSGSSVTMVAVRTLLGPSSV